MLASGPHFSKCKVDKDMVFKSRLYAVKASGTLQIAVAVKFGGIAALD